MLLVACGSNDELQNVATSRADLIGGRIPLESEYAATVYWSFGCTATKIGQVQFLLADHCVVDDQGALRPWAQPGQPFVITSDNDQRRFRTLTITQTRLPNPFYLSSSLLRPFAPDVAVISVAEQTPDIPVAVVDATTVNPGEPVVKTGYGCDNVTHSGPTPFRVHSAQALDSNVVLQVHPEAAASFPSYVTTARVDTDPDAASLCFGDSGGPLYRDVTPELLVVGVNSTASPWGDNHTRFDTQSYYGVASWLTSDGVRLRAPNVGTPYTGTPADVAGLIEAENYDLGGQGVAYSDNDPANQGASYRTDGVDIFAAGAASNGQYVHASAGEWLEYTVSAPSGADYALELHLAGSAASGPALHVQLDGENSSGPVSVPVISPFAWTNVTIPRLSLTPGRNHLRIVFDGWLDIDSFRFIALPPPCQDGTTDFGETDVDCGGAACAQCATGKGCVKDTDCATNFCLLGQCSTSLKPIDVSVGTQFACGLFADQMVRCWGRNNYGQLGVSVGGPIGDQPGELAAALQPVALSGPAIAIVTGTRHACALLQGGVLQCWGGNDSGQLGLGDLSNRFGPATVDVSGDPNVTVAEVSAGTFSTCARLSTGAVKCWGYNGQGQLGVGHTRTIGDGPNEMGSNLAAVNLPVAASALAVGDGHACALLGSTNEVRCWGADNYGQLGYGFSVGSAYGDSSDETRPNAAVLGTVAFQPTGITAGIGHTCALDGLHGKVKCWGRNDFGQLGYGDTASRGNASSDMGDNLNFVSIPPSFSFHARGYTTCARDVGNELRCWGLGAALLGQPQLASLGNIGDQTGELDSLPTIDFGSGKTVGNFSIGPNSGCVVLSNETVKCWGWNSFGELGLGDTQTRGDDVGEMGDALPRLLFP
jgi:alpha-tubulin suppressor-like RCC1 family protein